MCLPSMGAFCMEKVLRAYGASQDTLITPAVVNHLRLQSQRLGGGNGWIDFNLAGITSKSC